MSWSLNGRREALGREWLGEMRLSEGWQDGSSWKRPSLGEKAVSLELAWTCCRWEGEQRAGRQLVPASGSWLLESSSWFLATEARIH